MSNGLKEPAYVPLPRGISIQQKWTVKNNRKDKLVGYESKFLSELFNPALAFYKYPPDIAEKLSESKRAWLKALVDNFNFSLENIPEGHIYRLISDKDTDDEAIVNKLKNSLFSDFRDIKVITMQTAQPLIVGVGEGSPYETGITLDFLTGLPIIPGSALKGITRRAAIMKLSDKTDILPYGEEFEKLAKEYDNHHEITEIFGTQDKKGKVIFMDAYPVNWPDGKLFRLDVMNPHYGPYYENPSKNPPADWYNPVPIFYLTVNTNVKYRFILTCENENLLASKDKNLLETALDWLKFALTNIGIGAKGNQGYGIFKIEIERKA